MAVGSKMAIFTVVMFGLVVAWPFAAYDAVACAAQEEGGGAKQGGEEEGGGAKKSGEGEGAGTKTGEGEGGEKPKAKEGEGEKPKVKEGEGERPGVKTGGEGEGGEKPRPKRRKKAGGEGDGDKPRAKEGEGDKPRGEGEGEGDRPAVKSGGEGEEGGAPKAPSAPGAPAVASTSGGVVVDDSIVSSDGKKPDVAGKAISIFQDGKVSLITVKLPDQNGKAAETVVYMVEDTTATYAGTANPGEEKPTVGYMVYAWLKADSKDTAASIKFVK